MDRTGASVEGFLTRVPDEQRREDARRLCAMMQEITGETPTMRGSSIIGFGTYHYRYASGREGDSPLAGFSPRRPHLVIYLVGGFENRHRTALARLGPHKTGKGCLYIKRLGEVDGGALGELIDRSVRVRKGVDRACARHLRSRRELWALGYPAQHALIVRSAVVITEPPARLVPLPAGNPNIDT